MSIVDINLSIKSLNLDDDIWSIFDEKKEKNTIKNKCLECDSDNLVNDKGNIVCKNCGIINSHTFDQNPEWSYNEDGKNEGSARCGAPINYFLPNSSLGTTIVGGAGCYRLKKLHSWGQQPYKERSRSDVMQQIDERCKLHNISKGVAENAKYLYKKITEVKHKDGINQGKSIIIRGNNRISIIAACVFNGAQLQKQPSSLKEIASIFQIDVTQITKGIRKLEELLVDEPLLQTSEIIDPSKFISSYHGKLGLQREYIPIAIKISEYLLKDDIVSNHQPVSIAAGIILLISKIYKLDINKKKISVVLNISEVTINKIYNKINTPEIKEMIIEK